MNNDPAPTGADRMPQVVGLDVDHLLELLPDVYTGEPHFSPQGTPRTEPVQAGQLQALARALASSPAWAQMEEAVMVVRTAPPMGIAVMGQLDAEDLSRLEGLPDQLESELRRVRYVNWQGIEEDCELLGQRLTDHLGREAIEQAQFVGIPRGGVVVLGLLAYVLDLRPDQLVGARTGGTTPDSQVTAAGIDRTPDSAPAGSQPALVVVDDCALSGLRFRRFLEEQTEGPVVFAHLYSHPTLRSKIEETEERVRAVLSACDLNDHAREILGPDYEAWRARWEERAGGDTYWLGRPDRLGFPWSEPEIGVWNPITEREEPGWRLIPPEACLRNRVEQRASANRVQFQPPATGPLRTTAGTYLGQFEDGAVLANLRTGKAVRLSGMAPAIWQCLLAEGGVTQAAEALARMYDADRQIIDQDAHRIYNEFVEAGFLEDADTEPAPAHDV